MTRAPTILVLTSLAIAAAITGSACTSPDPSSTVPAASSPMPPTTNEAAGEVVAEVAYEPAYPDDVSEEHLSADDIAQQAPTHAHGDGEEHADDDEHAHDDGDDHHEHEADDDHDG